MPVADFQTLPLWLNLAIFIATALVVWIAGTRLSAAADQFATHTGIGRAFVGALLLGGMTSLPELTTTITAVRLENPALAVNNLIGGVAMQVTVLAIADWSLRKRPLARQLEDAAVLIQAALQILVLAVTAFGFFYGDAAIFGVGYWSLAVFISSLGALLLIRNLGDRQPWAPTAAPRAKAGADTEDGGHWRATLVIGSIAIVIAGSLLTHSADALAAQTGLHAGFIGAVTVALATSLPEISTTIGAVRLGQYSMAYSNIFGANLLDLSLLLAADIFFRGGPIMNFGDDFATGVSLLALLLTAITLVGLLDRHRRTVARVGPDSLLVVLVYLIGIALLYNIK